MDNMATIAENLQIIKNSIDSIKQAIIDKGGTISGDLTTWASAISGISGGNAGGSVLKSSVNFYDYDGTLLHSYTKDEFLGLNDLPELPTREGLICQGWNYNLTKAKEYVISYGVLDIGATYITDDEKTRLYIRIAAPGRMRVPLYFNQSVANGVTIDWGDGSSAQTLSGTGNVITIHTYTEIGDYCISLTVNNGTLSLGHNSSSYSIMGSTSTSSDGGVVYCNMLQRIEIGKGVTSISNYTFSYCYSLSSIVIPESVTSLGNYAFYYCYSLSSIVIPESVTSISSSAFSSCDSLSSVVIPESVTSLDNYAFYYCYSLSSIVIPESVTSFGNYAFSYCRGMAFYDFRSAKSVPTLQNSDVFNSISSDCKIVVPDSLYDSWKAAAKWSTYSSKIVKSSEFNL